MFSNEVLAKELFNLTFEQEIKQEHIEALLDLYKVSNQVVEKAQQSI